MFAMTKKFLYVRLRQIKITNHCNNAHQGIEVNM